MCWDITMRRGGSSSTTSFGGNYRLAGEVLVGLYVEDKERLNTGTAGALARKRGLSDVILCQRLARAWRSLQARAPAVPVISTALHCDQHAAPASSDFSTSCSNDWRIASFGAGTGQRGSRRPS